MQFLAKAEAWRIVRKRTQRTTSLAYLEVSLLASATARAISSSYTSTWSQEKLSRWPHLFFKAAGDHPYCNRGVKMQKLPIAEEIIAHIPGCAGKP